MGIVRVCLIMGQVYSQMLYGIFCGTRNAVKKTCKLCATLFYCVSVMVVTVCNDVRYILYRVFMLRHKNTVSGYH